jgi:hypothetical protein
MDGRWNMGARIYELTVLDGCVFVRMGEQMDGHGRRIAWIEQIASKVNRRERAME